ncbi:MAG TPA: glycosyltransferase family 4 protein [Chloroflexota bacterium]|nr:glycosyltransferase family 4 protein [Chloroflexota bacterium]
MKICLLTDELSYKHGWGRYSIAVIRALMRQGADLRILSPKRLCTETDLLEHPDHHSISSFLWETRSLLSTTLSNWMTVSRLVSGCDVVHCITEPYAPVAALAAGKRPQMITAHGTYSIYPLTRRKDALLLRYAYRRAAAVLCVSGFTERRLREKVSNVVTRVVPEGVDFERFQALADLSIAPSERYILSVGPIKPRKGYSVSLEAFTLAKKAVPDLQYYIVGMVHDDDFHQQLLGSARKAGIEDSVHFLGQVPDEQLRALYRGCQLFVLTPLTLGTQFEGFGLIYLEANACGKPVVGSYGCGAEEAIVDGETGILVPQGQPEAAAEAMVKLLKDPDMAARMGEAGYQRAGLMSWDVTAAKVIEQYEAALAARG